MADGMHCSAGRYVGNEVSEKSTSPRRTTLPYSDIVECELLLDSLGMFRQKIPSPDESLDWRKGYFCIAENLDVWYIINKMENLIESTPMCMGTLVINQEDIQKTCKIWKVDNESHSVPLDNEKSIGRCGFVKKKGQYNSSYKDRFLVLNKDGIEYFEDVQAYIASQIQRAGTKLHKGSLSIRTLKVSSGTPNGVDKSCDGYHFTIESTVGAKAIECACMDEQGRNMWVRKIQEAMEASKQQVVHVSTFTHTLTHTRASTHTNTSNIKSGSSLLQCSIISSMPSVLVVTVCQRKFCEYFTIRYA
jgi:hypothetical protein